MSEQGQEFFEASCPDGTFAVIRYDKATDHYTLETWGLKTEEEAKNTVRQLTASQPRAEEGAPADADDNY